MKGEMDQPVYAELPGAAPPASKSTWSDKRDEGAPGEGKIYQELYGSSPYPSDAAAAEVKGRVLHE